MPTTGNPAAGAAPGIPERGPADGRGDSGGLGLTEPEDTTEHYPARRATIVCAGVAGDEE
jgi:hypothetical protein